MLRINKGDVVQFVEGHKWCGCLGIVTQVKVYKDDIRYTVGVDIPERGIAYIFVLHSSAEIERIGRAVMVPGSDDEEEE